MADGAGLEPKRLRVQPGLLLRLTGQTAAERHSVSELPGGLGSGQLSGHRLPGTVFTNSGRTRAPNGLGKTWPGFTSTGFKVRAALPTVLATLSHESQAAHSQ